MTYALPVSAPILKKSWIQIEKCHRFAARLIMNDYLLSYDDILSALSWKSMHLLTCELQSVRLLNTFMVLVTMRPLICKLLLKTSATILDSTDIFYKCFLFQVLWFLFSVCLVFGICCHQACPPSCFIILVCSSAQLNRLIIIVLTSPYVTYSHKCLFKYLSLFAVLFCHCLPSFCAAALGIQ